MNREERMDLALDLATAKRLIGQLLDVIDAKFLRTMWGKDELRTLDRARRFIAEPPSGGPR